MYTSKDRSISRKEYIKCSIKRKKEQSIKYLNRLIFSSILVTVLMLLMQVAVIVVAYAWLGSKSPLFLGVFQLIGVIIIVIIYNDHTNPAYKMSWMIIIAFAPFFGTILYIYVRSNIGSVVKFKTMREVILKSSGYLSTDPNTSEAIKELEAPVYKTFHYIEKMGNYPSYNNTGMKYYSPGDKGWERLLEELRRAEEYIFLEYFIIEEGIFFTSILDILKNKVKEGVEVRLIYDGFGCAVTLPRRYDKILESYGIKARTFARLAPFLSTHYNNRDHRKAIIIDGKVAISGGLNIADEYVNEYERFGHWLDNMFILEGDGVKNYTLMFLQIWQSILPEESIDYEYYLRDRYTRTPLITDGYVAPFGDGPHQIENLAETIYMDIISNAKEYVYIATPYLILDYGMQETIMHAAECGVDIRLFLPGIPDKKMVFWVTRSHYLSLIRAGVKIYEYIPGFIHSKIVMADGEIAVTGTINLDFRSLYLHYESGCLFYKNDGIKSIEEDFNNMIMASKLITEDIYMKIPTLHRVLGRLFRMMGPLL